MAPGIDLSNLVLPSQVASNIGREHESGLTQPGFFDLLQQNHKDSNPESEQGPNTQSEKPFVFTVPQTQIGLKSHENNAKSNDAAVVSPVSTGADLNQLKSQVLPERSITLVPNSGLTSEQQIGLETYGKMAAKEVASAIGFSRGALVSIVVASIANNANATGAGMQVTENFVMTSVANGKLANSYRVIAEPSAETHRDASSVSKTASTSPLSVNQFTSSINSRSVVLTNAGSVNAAAATKIDLSSKEQERNRLEKGALVSFLLADKWKESNLTKTRQDEYDKYWVRDFANPEAAVNGVKSWLNSFDRQFKGQVSINGKLFWRG